MALTRRFPRIKTAPAVIWAAFAVCAPLHAQQPAAPQGVPENSVTRVSDHVYAIIGFPNIGIIVGERATLVVDTGMGPPNGAIVVREAQKLAKSPNLYLTTTHFHPEHAAGAPAFPPRTLLTRPAVQHEATEQHGVESIETFRSRSALFR